MIYETGCQGIVIASALERLGFLGKLVHIYQTGSPQTQSISAMNFGIDKEKLNEVLMTINMYHLRSLEQGKDITHMHTTANSVREFYYLPAGRYLRLRIKTEHILSPTFVSKGVKF